MLLIENISLCIKCYYYGDARTICCLRIALGNAGFRSGIGKFINGLNVVSRSKFYIFIMGVALTFY